MDCCYDCKLNYDNFPCDMVIQNHLWTLISPTNDEGGLLCPNCICKRLMKLGLTAVKVTVDMSEFAKADNLQCPACKGHGVLEAPKKGVIDMKMRNAAVINLFNAGYSYREISKMFGMKSHSSIQKIIKQQKIMKSRIVGADQVNDTSKQSVKCVCRIDDRSFKTDRQSFGGNIYKHAGVKFSTHDLWLKSETGNDIFIEANETVYTLNDGDRFFATKKNINNG